MERRTQIRVVLTALVAFLPVTTIVIAPGASAAPAPIKIALITDLTGPGGPIYSSSPSAFDARIDLQNAEGGVNGHKLVPLVIDDQTSPTAVMTAVQDALSRGALGMVSTSGVFFLAAKYPQQAGVPVTGSYSDGPEWGEQPYINMFASDLGSINPTYPVNTLEGKILKHYGGTTLATYGYSISPMSSQEAVATARSFGYAGGRVGLVDTSLPFGAVNFTTLSLVAKQKHINALFPTMENSSNYALATALKQAGVKIKAAVFATGYQPSVVNSPTWADVQGDYFLSIFRPFSAPNAGTKEMTLAMQKYAHFSKKQFPTFGQYEGWSGADLMIKGLQMAGTSPTSAGVMKALRGLKSYDASGLLPNPINYSTIFGHDPPKQCVWVLRAQKTGFVITSPQPVCGTDIPGTSTKGA